MFGFHRDEKKSCNSVAYGLLAAEKVADDIGTLRSAPARPETCKQNLGSTWSNDDIHGQIIYIL